MNETTAPAGTADTPWTSRVPPMRVSATSPVTEPATPVQGMLDSAVQGAHDTIDRFADSAAPAARRLGESVSSARDTLQAKTGQMRESGDEWVQGARTTISGSPLLSVAAAFALGAFVARITR
jgi:hypothetical protein